MKRTLVLFDVDGTLLVTGGAGSRSMRKAMQQVFGESFEWAPVTVGLLDPQIFEEMALHNRVDGRPFDAKGLHDLYIAELEAELGRVREEVVVMPGIRELLMLLHARRRERDDVVLGLLTGNFSAAVPLKLGAAGIDMSMFEVNAFAEDGATRNELPLRAMARYEELTGEPAQPERVIIIGDTPRDIECALVNGCRVLPVATGHFGIEELREAGGELTVADLSDAGALLRLIDGGT